MSPRALAASLACALLLGCGHYGSPVRTHGRPPADAAPQEEAQTEEKDQKDQKDDKEQGGAERSSNPATREGEPT